MDPADLTERVDERIKAAEAVSRIDFEGFVSGEVEKEDPETARRMAMGTHVCKEIRQRLFKELGYTCCGGLHILIKFTKRRATD